MISKCWSEARTLEDIESHELRKLLYDSANVIELVEEALNRTGRTCQGISIDLMKGYIDAIVSNISTEIARREIAYDRRKLDVFRTLPISELVESHEPAQGEFVRAYLMRHREKTGEELIAEDLGETTIVI